MMASDVPSAPGALGLEIPYSPLDAAAYADTIDDTILDDLEVESPIAWPTPLAQKTILAMLELASSERKFVDQLERLVNLYLPRLPPVFPPTSVSLLTRNAPALLELHTRLAAALTAKVNSRPGLCQVLVSYAGELASLHSEFCAGHSAAKALLNRAQARDPQLWATWEKERADECPPEEDGSRPRALEDLMIAPVQRVCRYHLLVKSLRDGSEEEDVYTAMRKMESVAADVDEIARVRQDEDRAKVVVERMDPIPNQPPGFLATLGSCILIGTVDMIYYSIPASKPPLVSVSSQTSSLTVSNSTLPSPPPSALPFPQSQPHPLLSHPKPPKAKHLAAFLWTGYLVLAKVHTKRCRYEPKHWFPLKIVPNTAQPSSLNQHVIDSGVSDCDPSESSPDASPWFAETALPDTSGPTLQPKKSFNTKHSRAKSHTGHQLTPAQSVPMALSSSYPGPLTPHPDVSSSDTTPTMSSLASSSTVVPASHVDVGPSDDLFPYGIRITFGRHVFELGAACAEERDLWVEKIAAARIGDKDKEREGVRGDATPDRGRAQRARSKSRERGALREKSRERGALREKSRERVDGSREKSRERGAFELDKPRLVEPERERPRVVTDLDRPRMVESDRSRTEPDRRDLDRPRLITDSRAESDRPRLIMDSDRSRPELERPRLVTDSRPTTDDKGSRRDKSRERGVLTVVQPSAEGPKQIGSWMVQVLNPVTVPAATVSAPASLHTTPAQTHATAHPPSSSGHGASASSSHAPSSSGHAALAPHAHAPTGSVAARVEDMWLRDKGDRETRDRYGHGHGYSYVAANQAYAPPSSQYAPPQTYIGPTQAYNQSQTHNGTQSYNSAQAYNGPSQAYSGPSQAYSGPSQAYNPPQYNPPQSYNPPHAYGISNGQVYTPAAPSTYAGTSSYASSTYSSTTATSTRESGSTYASSTYSASTVVPSTYAPTVVPSTYAPSNAPPSTYAPSTVGPTTYASSTTAPSTYAPSTITPSTYGMSASVPSTSTPSTYTHTTPTSSTYSNSTTPTTYASGSTPTNASHPVPIPRKSSTSRFGRPSKAERENLRPSESDGRTLGATVARTNSSSTDRSRSFPSSPVATAHPLAVAQPPLQVQTQLESKSAEPKSAAQPIVRRPSSNIRDPIVLALADVISSNCREARDRASIKRRPLWMTPEEAQAEAAAKAANTGGGVMGMVRPRRMSSALVGGSGKKALLDSLPGDRKDKADREKDKEREKKKAAARPSSSEGVVVENPKTPLQRKRATIHGAMHSFPTMDPPSPAREPLSHGHSQSQQIPSTVQVVAPGGQVVAQQQVPPSRNTAEGPISPPRSRTVSSSGSFVDGMREFLMLRRTFTKSAENVAAVQAAALAAEAPNPIYAVGAGLTNTRSEEALAARAKAKATSTPTLANGEDDGLYSLGAGITNTNTVKRKHKTSLRASAAGMVAALTKRRTRSGQAPLSALTFTPLSEKEQENQAARSQTARSRSNEWYHPVPAVRNAPNRGMLGAELYTTPALRVQPSPVAEEGKFADFGDEVYDEERY